MRGSTLRYALGAFGFLLLAAPGVASAAPVTITSGTPVILAFDKQVSSKTAKAGDRVPMHVMDAVMVSGQTIVKAGAPVTGVIDKVDKRGHFGVNAKLHLSLEPVKSVSGVMIPLAPKSKGKVVGSRTGEAGLASGGGALLLGPVGLVGGYFVVGKPITVHVGDKLVSEVTRDTTIAMR